jgi:hypothetical protein
MITLEHRQYYAITVKKPESYKIERADTIGRWDAITQQFMVVIPEGEVGVAHSQVTVVQRLPT